VLHVAGGKLTTMRRMGEETVNRAVELLQTRGVDRRLGAPATRERPLPGGVGQPDLGQYELAPDVETRLRNAYGARARNVLALTRADESLSRRLVPQLPYLRAEVLFAARHDHACEVEDVLRRRVPLFRDAPDQGLSVAEDAADLLASEFGWSAERRARSLDAYRAAVSVSQRWRAE
jgi:glycerol-3-phosphate dehydrogenase